MLFITAALLPVLALAGPVDKRWASPNPNLITISDFANSGSGCPQGTVSSVLSPDATVLTLGFDSFQVQSGPGTTATDHSKNCEITLDLNYPGGFQFAIIDATYHGFAQLAQGVTGRFFSTYFFSENAFETCTTTATLSGSEWLNGNIYEKDDVLAEASFVWSPCGAAGTLSVNNRVVLFGNGKGQSSLMTDDDATFGFTNQIHVAWRQC